MFCWRASRWLDLSFGRLQGKASPFAVFTFAFGHSCKQVLLVIRIRWAIRTGSKHELYVVCVWWAIQIGIKHWRPVTGVRTLLLALQTVCRENQLCWAVKTSEFILTFFEKYIALFSHFISWSIALLSHFHYWLNILQYDLLEYLRCP